MITIPTLAITTLISLLYTHIADYIALLGGFCSVIISFIMPCKYICKNILILSRHDLS